MFKFLPYLIFVGALVQIIGIVPYIKDTLAGRTRPNKVSWLMWAVSPLIATAAALSDGVRWAVLPVFLSGFCPLLVFIVSFVNPHAYWKLERFDYICGFCSLAALVLWGVTKEPVVAILFAIASDGFAAIPTLIKLWNYPKTETVSAYVAGLVNALTAFGAVTRWSFSSYAFAVYLVIINSSLIISYFRRKIFSI